jgi:squalene cyclase
VNLSTSIEGGLHYLRSNQTDAGFWSDWQLPPGESRMWTTAYVGYRLSMLPRIARATVDEHLTHAHAWLRASELPDGGWGYTEQTGADADSTSLALLFLHSRGDDVASEGRLCAYQQPDGGFSTFTRDASYGSWVLSHPDVTAIALLALKRKSLAFTDRMRCGLGYLRQRQRADGLWNSFWWTSCLYSTEAALAFLHAAGEITDRTRITSALRAVPTPTAFESALLLLCLIRLGKADDPLAMECVRTLQSKQLPDGSWASGPILRLTSRDISEPWLTEDAGPLFGDARRVFTTATVIPALSGFL